MAAIELNLLIERGAGYSNVITWRDEALALVSLVGATADLDVRVSQIETSTQIATFTVANGRLTLGGAAGTVTLTMTAVDTALLAAQTGWYDLHVTLASGVTHKLAKGVVVIENGVTA